MTYSRGDLYMDSHKLNDQDITKLCGQEVFETYKSASAQRRTGKTFTTIGWTFFIVGGIVSVTWVSLLDDEEALLLSGISMFGVSNLLLPIGYVCRGIGSGRLNSIANDYNDRHQYAQNFELSINPSLFRANNMIDNQQYGLGATLTLKF